MWKKIKSSDPGLHFFLKKNEPVSISLSERITGERSHCTFYALYQNNRLTAAAVVEKRGDVYLHSETEFTTKEAEALAKQIKSKIGIPLSISGEASNTEAVSNFFSKKILSRVNYTYMSARISNIVAKNRIMFKTYKAQMQDLAVLIPLQKAYLLEEVYELRKNLPDKFTGSILYNILKNNYLYFIAENEKIISKANTNALGFISAQIGGVYTIKEQRNKGLAGSVITALLSGLPEQYKKVGLFVKKSNYTAAGLYKKMGFQDVCDYDIIYFKS
jgi:ribosomal protein S18 acetylase RimI-like enzyme